MRRTAGDRRRPPDVFSVGGWVPMREFRDDEEVDFVVVGTGAGGGPAIAGLAEGGFSVVGMDAEPWFRPLEDFASDETEQNKLRIAVDISGQGGLDRPRRGLTMRHPYTPA